MVQASISVCVACYGWLDAVSGVHVPGRFVCPECVCSECPFGASPCCRGERHGSTPPSSESVSLILAASAAKNKFPQGRLGLRPGRPQITFEVT